MTEPRASASDLWLRLWGSLVSCGRLAIGLFLRAASLPPEVIDVVSAPHQKSEMFHFTITERYNCKEQ